MNSNNRNYIITAALFITASCGLNGSRGGELALSGKITSGGSGGKIMLEHLSPSKAQVVDTAIIDDEGNFAFEKIVVKEIGYYRIKKSDRHFITLILEPKDKTVIESGWELGADPYIVTGSKESLRLQELNNMMTKFYMARDSMNYLFQSNPGDQSLLLKLQEEFAALSQENVEFARAFIDRDPSSFACLAAAEQLDIEKDMTLFQKIDKGMGEKYPKSAYYIEFHKMVASHLALSAGSEAPDIILPDAGGNLTKLSSLRGKVVLVDFWASWCRPCRQENPNVVRAYQKYKDKGFEVFGVSLDQSRDKWLEAIQADNLNWTQVSDLQFWNSSVVKLYDIKGIPFAVLLDREGKIIAKNLRGPELEAKLEEILN